VNRCSTVCVPTRAARVGLLSLTATLLTGCTTTALPPPAAERLTPTACEKRALWTGQAPDLAAVAAVADAMWWGLLAPETCPDAGGHLDRRGIER
jgi:hypothetical protein